ncbi:MAG TPA: PQQ-dependent sugar dehydrogenase [Polyangiales bacterium]|nr:PQQ-dependent sugar dehydrogenase [Polyangiales bacterium]
MRWHDTTRLLLTWLLAAVGGCTANDLGESPAAFQLVFEPVATRTGDAEPQTVAHMELTGLAFLPDDLGLLVWEKRGRVAHYRLQDDALIFQGEFHLPRVATTTDCGLISIALDPDWRDNQLIYAGHCTSTTHSAVTRYRFDATNYDQVPKTGVEVIAFGDATAKRAWHNVGAIGFFSDAERSMWILVGDKNNGANAQDTSRNLGGVLRIIPKRDAEGGYEPHPDNPFGGPGSDPERESSPDLYAWGFRSPWRGALDAQGRLWVGDVGNRYEEINLVSKAAQNFGWSKQDGPCDSASCADFTDPLVSWDHGSNHRYRVADPQAFSTWRRVAWVGTPYAAHPDDPYSGFLDDATLIADMCVGFVRAVGVDARGRLVRNEQVGHFVGLSGMAQAADGVLYVTSFGSCAYETYGVGGGIYRVGVRRTEAPPPAAAPESHAPLVDEPLGPMPLKLSDTGIFKDATRKQPIARAVRYEPSLPLWSNGSAKDRWLLLPEGGRIDNTQRDRWEFPEGTLFFKTFGYPDSLNGQKVETRIIRRTHDGWDYHAYQWRDGDADLLSLEVGVPAVVKFEGGDKLTHEIPSRFDCRACHESNPTVVIGFDELRLSKDLDALAARGVFTHAPPAEPEHIEHPDARTRDVLGYLHGNCAHCHNGAPSSMSQLDLRHAQALENTLRVPTEGSGQAAGIRIVPGEPEQSILYLALTGQGDDAELQPMPPIGVQRRDSAAIAKIEAWIRGLPRD